MFTVTQKERKDKMMKNNPIKKIKIVQRLTPVVSIFLFLTYIGCESLDFQDPNAPAPQDASFQILITGAEAGMRIQTDQYLEVVSIFGREAYFFEPADPRFTTELLHGPLDSNGFLLNNPWESRYRVVANAEILIEKAAADPLLTPEEKASVTGFSKTVKAYQLLLNLNYTYNNGIKLNISDDINAPVAGRDDAFAFISNLLDEGYAELQTAGDAFFFQLSSGFSGFDTPAGFAQFNRAIRARVGAYMASLSGSPQDWQTVLDAVDKSFLDLSGDLDLGAYHVFGSGLGNRPNFIFEVPTASFVKFRAHPSFRTDAEPSDLRFASKVFDRTDDPNFAPGFGSSDLFSSLPITITNSTTDRLPIIRNEELILIRAEAYIGLGNFAQAQQAINVVRAAAGLAAVNIDDSNAVDQLLFERRYSLFAEGHRWVDMRRYNRLGQLPLDRTGDPIRPDDQVFEQFPMPFDEVPGDN